MSKVDKAILRMAVYELRFCPDIPPKVALNEAIDLGKLFGSENSGAFINGILDALHGPLRTRAKAPGTPAGTEPSAGKSRPVRSRARTEGSPPATARFSPSC
jgi:hypothetical protein